MDSHHGKRLSRAKFVSVVVLGILVFSLVVSFLIVNWTHLKVDFGFVPRSALRTPPKPASFYYVTTFLPNKVPSVMPKDIVIDPKGKITSVTMMVAAGKPTLYMLDYSTALTTVQVYQGYLEYFSQQKIATYYDDQGHFSFASKSPSAYRIKYNSSIDAQTGLVDVKITFVQYD